MRLLSVKEVAEALCVSAVTVYRLADQGTLPPVVLAQRRKKRIIRFRAETVEKFIAEREQHRARHSS